MGCILRVSHHNKTIFLIKILKCKNANEGTRFQKLSHIFRRSYLISFILFDFK